MIEHRCHVLQCRAHIRFWHERDVVFLHRFHEPIEHAVTLWTTHCSCSGFQIQLSGELTHVMRRIRRTVVCLPLHWFIREPCTEALFNRAQHHVLNGNAVITTDARSPVYDFSVAAGQHERNP